MPLQPCFRLARAVVFATVCLTLTTAGHATAAHTGVPPAAVGLGFVLATALSLLLAGAERSFGTILGGLAGGQFGLHALFTAACAGGAHHGVPPVPRPAPAGGLAMTLVHLGAAVAAAWWIRRGEAAMWSLARRISAAAARTWRPLAVAPRPVPAGGPRLRPAAPVRPPADGPLRHALVRRGPPR